jgi:DNA-binding NtrC family response regulator
MSARILVVDDERNIRLMLEQMLGLAGHEVHTVETGEEALRRLEDEDFDGALVDVRLPGIDGLEVLRRALATRPDLAVVMMSGHGTIETAVRAVREGAYDFLEKPLGRDTTLVTLENALRVRALTVENRRLRVAVGRGDLVGDSRAMQALRERIAQVAPTEATVLVLGESGSGKELVASALHRGSRRSERAFVAVNCAAIPESLIESELFGHVRGAFTGAVGARAGKFEAADGGTLFLDEIGDMPPAAQAKLLRVLETREVSRVGSNEARRVDVRVIAATHRDLLEHAREGAFREDLYHRLNVVPIEVPPLRDRTEDVPGLADLFLERAVARQGLGPRRLSSAARQRLGRYDWPGNVRELKNLVERLAIVSPHETIDDEQVESELPDDRTAPESVPATLREIVADAERRAIERAVTGAGGNVAEAARRLGLERAHLYKKARALGVSLRDL